jgi:ABC-type transporter MlaC component
MNVIDIMAAFLMGSTDASATQMEAYLIDFMVEISDLLKFEEIAARQAPQYSKDVLTKRITAYLTP